MKGIYITEEGKKDLLERIDSLEKIIVNCLLPEQQSVRDLLEQELFIKKEILSSATILPVESNMSYVKSYDFVDEFDTEYPQGVIIQPKQ